MRILNRNAVCQRKYGIVNTWIPGIFPTLHLIKLVHFFTDSLSTSYSLEIKQKSEYYNKKIIDLYGLSIGLWSNFAVNN